MHDSEVRGSLARAEAEAGESNPQALASPSPPHHTPHPLDFYNADTGSGAINKQPTQSTTMVYIH
jgi:hypothetical protein